MAFQARRASRRALGLLFVCAVAVGGAAADEVPSGTKIVVPGGRAALSRLVGGLDLRPERFAWSLNRALLLKNNDEEQTAARAAVVEYVQVVAALRERFGEKLTFKPKNRLSRRMLAALGADAGFALRSEGDGLLLEPQEGDIAHRRRRYMRMLGLDLQIVVQALNAGRETTVDIAQEEVDSPLPFEHWNRITMADPPVTATNALGAFAKDGRLGMIVGGLERLSPAARAALDDGRLAALYASGAELFFRHAGSFDVDESGALRLPGGPRAAARWQEFVGAPPAPAGPFIMQLLAKDGGRAAALFTAFSFAPPKTAAAVLGRSAARSPLAAIHDALRESPDSWSTTRGLRADLPRLLAALPLGADGDLALPGGNAAWFKALDPRAPETPAGFVAAVCGARIKNGRVERPAAGAALATLALLRARPKLAAPEMIAPLLRAQVLDPLAFVPLRDLPFDGPERALAYLRAVDALSAESAGPETFTLLANFEGGIETLRRAARGGLPAPLALAAFDEWLAAHPAGRPLRAAGAAELDWLVSFARRLPPAADDAPGRGPLERAFLAAAAPGYGARRFVWQGMDLERRRGRDDARAFAAQMARQGIPSLDDVARVADLFSAGSRAAARGDWAETRRAAKALAKEAATFGAPPAGAVLPDAEKSVFGDPDAAELDGELARAAKLAKGSPADESRRFAEARGLLAHRLRPLLLAAAFVDELPRAPRFLERSPTLIRDHSVIRHFDDLELHALDAVDTPWQPARFSHADNGKGRSRTFGHPSNIARALAGLQVASPAGAPARRRTAADLARTWYPLVVEADWSVVEKPGLVPPAASAPDGAAPAPPAAAKRVLLGAPAGDAVSRSERAAAVGGEAIGALARGLPGTLDFLDPDRPFDAPAYEELESEATADLLQQRMFLDFWLAVAGFAAEARLPGDVARDLALDALRRMPAEVEMESPRDWRRIVSWTNGLRTKFFEEGMRECLAKRWSSPR